VSTRFKSCWHGGTCVGARVMAAACPSSAAGPPSSADVRCPSTCKRCRLLDTWVAAARRHGVPQHKVVPWVRRKLGPAVVVLRFRGDGQLGCSIPCVLCQRELQRFDLSVHCYLGDTGDDQERRWFCGRLTDEGAPAPVLTAGQRRTLNLDPTPARPPARAPGPRPGQAAVSEVHPSPATCSRGGSSKSKKSNPR
jgi:hypothetical protein